MSNAKTLTGDAFTDGLIIASWFCTHESDSPRPVLEYIKIDENKLTSCDGFQAIEITCNIPEQYKNSYIHWRVDSLQEIKTVQFDNAYPNLHEIFDESTYKHKSKIDVVSAKNKWIGEEKEIEKQYKAAVYVNFGKVKFLFNENLLTNGMDAISGNQQAEVFYKNNKSPLLIKADNMKVIVLPMRFPKS